MNLIKEITNEDIGLERKEVRYDSRKAVRAVLFNGDKVALLFASRHNFHKIPGGGIKANEDMMEALKREIMEETGCTARILEEIGYVVELRDDHGLKQTSYCYMARVIECNQKPAFTKKEKRQGFELKWVNIDKAIKLIEDDKPDIYEGKFIVERDIEFLKRAKSMQQ